MCRASIPAILCVMCCNTIMHSSGLLIRLQPYAWLLIGNSHYIPVISFAFFSFLIGVMKEGIEPPLGPATLLISSYSLFIQHRQLYRMSYFINAVFPAVISRMLFSRPDPSTLVPLHDFLGTVRGTNIHPSERQGFEPYKANDSTQLLFLSSTPNKHDSITYLLG